MTDPASGNTPRILPIWQQLRWRLIALFIIIALLPTGFLFGVMDQQTTRQYTEQTIAQLESIAEIKSDQIVRYLDEGDTAMEVLVSDPARHALFVDLLTADVPDPETQRQVFILLREMANAQTTLKDLAIYRPDGTIVAASIDHWIGTHVNNTPYFQRSLEVIEDYVESPYYNHAEAEFEIIITHRLEDENGNTAGVISAELNINQLGLIMTERTGLGATGETYLVSLDESLLLTPVLGDNMQVGQPLNSAAIDRALEGQDSRGAFTNYSSDEVIGVYRWLPEIEAALVAEIGQQEAFASRNAAREISNRLAALMALLAGVAGLAAATFIASPVQEMTDVATEFSGGDLTRRVKSQRRGEIGMLGEALNSMADQLQSMVATLENRVQDRTRALELAAEVAREVSAALNLEQVLNRVVELTKERFNLYHTHVYLLDDEKTTLVMEAGAGEAGHLMKEAGHSIPLNAERSLVARAARTGKPVIVNDVRAEPDHLPNPLLPDTQSEMAVPMRFAEEVVGVLDVQANQVGRFNEDDSQVLTTLADQVAVAVQNARLYQRTGQSESLLRSVIDASQDWIWAKDRDFNFVLANKALAEQAFGRTVDEIVGKNDYDIFPRELVDGDPSRGIKGFRVDDMTALNGDIVSIPSDVVRHIDGSEHILDTQKSPLYDAEGNIIGTLGIGRDVSVQYNARRRQQSAYEMGEVLTRLLDPQTLLREAVVRVAATFEYYHTHVYLVDVEGMRLVVAEGLGEAGEVMKAVGHSIPLNAERSLVARAARERRPIVVDDVSAQPDHLPNPLLPETRSEIAIPLISANEVIGVLDVQQDDVSHFDEDEIRTLQIIATQLAIGLSNARLYEDAQTALAETAALYAASEQLGRATSLDGVLKALVSTSVMSQFDRANIGLFDRPWSDEQRPQTLTIAAVWERSGGAARTPAGTMYPADRMPIMSLMGRDNPLIVEDVSHDERVDAFTREAFTNVGTNAVIGLPLTIGDQWIGVVTAQNAERTSVSDQQVRFVDSLIGQAASVTQNLRLYQEVQNALSDSRATQRLLRSVIDTTPDWIWVKDRQGRFVTMNASMAAAFGARHEEVLGKTDADIGVAPEVMEHNRADDRTVFKGKPLTIPAEFIRQPDGRETVLETRKLPLYDAEGNTVAVLGISTDITERRRTQMRERLAYELGQDLVVLFNPELLLKQTIAHVADALGYYHAHIYRADPQQGLLTVAEGLGEAGEILKQMGHSIPMNAERSLVARAARTLDPVVVNDVSSDPEHLPNPLLPDTKSEAAIPLYSGQRLLGVLDVQHNVLNAFSEPEVRTLRVVANQLATALSNAELYQEQIQNAERLRELDRLKSEFLANMSHELRTPLNSIIGYSELLIDEVSPTLDEMSAEDLKAIHSSGQHLLAIINDILDLAKIEAGRLELNRTDMMLQSVALPLADSARVLLKDKPDVDLQIDLPDTLPEVSADTVRLRQILWNLLSNAIKFTDHGSISLSAKSENSEMVITVRDSGAGIDPHYHSIVFDQFRQADGSATRKAGGTGLGLAITRQLVELHGGRIWLESAAGQGSTFTFTLPLAAVAASQPGEPAAAVGD